MTPVPAALAVCLSGGMEDDHVLLVKRRNRPDAGLWGYPGGKLDPGETTAAAAVRELYEETGVTAGEGPLLAVIEVRQEGFAFDLHAHLCVYESGTPLAADDADEALWVPQTDVLARRLAMSDAVDQVLRAALDLAPRA